MLYKKYLLTDWRNKSIWIKIYLIHRVSIRFKNFLAKQSTPICWNDILCCHGRRQDLGRMAEERLDYSINGCWRKQYFFPLLPTLQQTTTSADLASPFSIDPTNSRVVHSTGLVDVLHYTFFIFFSFSFLIFKWNKYEKFKKWKKNSRKLKNWWYYWNKIVLKKYYWGFDKRIRSYNWRCYQLKNLNSVYEINQNCERRWKIYVMLEVWYSPM